jgi:hypothetical protein
MNDVIDQETGEVEDQAVVPYGSTAPAVSDPQVALALARPSRPAKVIQQAITDLATMDEESARECLYALVRGGKKKGRNPDEAESKPIEGPSIRLAEIAFQQYGNCRVEAHVVLVNRAEKFVEAEGVFIDLENNTGSRASVRRRISTKSGHLFSEDMILVTGNAACAIAKRNAILAGIPRPIVRHGYEAARRLIAGEAHSIPERFDRACKSFASYVVKPEQLLASLSIESSDQLTTDNMATLFALFQSIKNGEVTVEEAFAPEKREQDPDYDPLKTAAQGGGKPEDGKPEKPSDEALDKAFGEGKAAKKDGKTIEENPHQGALGDAWRNGFEEA